MSQTIDAIYEGGVLRPIQPVQGIHERSRVTVTIEDSKEKTHPLEACFGILPDEDAEDMRRVIEDTFEKVDLSEWK